MGPCAPAGDHGLLAAASEPALADGIAGLLAFAKELDVAPDRLAPGEPALVWRPLRTGPPPPDALHAVDPRGDHPQHEHRRQRRINVVVDDDAGHLRRRFRRAPATDRRRSRRRI